jgi:hypothetical protein
VSLELETIELTPSVAPAADAASPFANAPLFAPAPANPFFAAIPPSPVVAVEQIEGEGEYRMLKSGPAVHPDEVEHAHASAIEIKVL